MIRRKIVDSTPPTKINYTNDSFFEPVFSGSNPLSAMVDDDQPGFVKKE